MKTEGTIVNIIFDTGRGSDSLASREGKTGMLYGELPTPVRRGYRFEGWYWNGERITAETVLESDTDVRLSARWTRIAEPTNKRASSFKRQKRAIIVLAAVAVILILVWVGVSQLIATYPLIDTYTKDGVEYSDRYTVKREGGVYKLFDQNGNRMPTNDVDEDVFITPGSGNQYRIDPNTGEYRLKAVVIPDEQEAVEGTTLLLFPQISYKYLYSLEVRHESDSYRFYSTTDGVKLEGFEDSLVEIDKKLYSKLCIATGWVAATRKLTPASDVAKNEDGTIDYTVYGLDTPVTTFTIQSILFKKDENGTPIYENNLPVIDYKVGKDENGDEVKEYKPDPDACYTVLIGDMTPSKTGYYARLEGSSSVYILGADYLSETAMKPVEALVVPRALHNVSVNMHIRVNGFYLKHLDEWSPEGNENGEVIVAFTFRDLDARQNTMSTTRPFVNLGDALMDGYEINATSASTALGLLQGMQYISCVKLTKINNEVLEEYGLDKNIHYLSYGVDVNESDGIDSYVDNQIIIGEKNENGNYYIASIPYDMIVEVSPKYLTFLEWDSARWYDKYFLSQNIAYVQSMLFEMGGKTYDIKMDNALSQAYYLAKTTDSTGKTTTVLSAVDPSSGYLTREGNKVVYKKKNGATYDAILLDLNTVEVLSYEEAVLHPEKSNILYTKVIYYYTKDGKSVQVVPNFTTKDIIRRDGAYYYVEYDKNGGVSREIQVKRQFGDPVYRYQPGLESTVMVSTDFLQLIANGTLLDYTLTNRYTDDTGVERVESVTALENFKRFYMQLIVFSLEGDVDPKEFKEKTGKTMEEFLQGSPTPDATITICAEDYASILNAFTYFTKDEDSKKETEHVLYPENNTKNLVVRFYRYSDWKTFVTVQTFEIDENGNKVFSDAGEGGKFFVNYNYLEELRSNLERFINQQIIPE